MLLSIIYCMSDYSASDNWADLPAQITTAYPVIDTQHEKQHKKLFNVNCYRNAAV